MNRTITEKNNTTNLELVGFDPLRNERITWLDLSLKEDDKIIVEVKDISKVHYSLRYKEAQSGRYHYGREIESLQRFEKKNSSKKD